MKLGLDPQGERVEARRQADVRTTFGMATDAFLARLEKTARRKNVIENTRLLKAHARPLHKFDIKAVHRGEIAKLPAKTADKMPATSNLLRSALTRAL